MCKQDFEIGRDTQSSVTSVAMTAGTSRQILSPDPYRVALVLSPPSSGSITYSTQANPTDGEGITFHQGGGPLALNIKDHGDMVRRPWFAWSSNSVLLGLLTTQWRKD